MKGAPGAPSTRGRKPTVVSFRPEHLALGFIRDEVPGPVGLVLALALRDVTLWAHVPPVRRAGLFDTPLPEIPRFRPEPLRSGLAVFAALVAAPERQDAAAVARACEEVAEWAEAHGLERTAAAYRAALPFLARSRAA